MIGVEGGDLVEHDFGEERFGADGAGVVDLAAVEVIGVASEDLDLAGGGGGFGFHAEEDGDVLERVEPVGDEEGDDDDVRGGGESGPVGDEWWFFHVGVDDFCEAAVHGADDFDLVLDGLGGVVIEAGAVADDDETAVGERDAFGDFGGAFEEEPRHGRVDADGVGVVGDGVAEVGGAAGEAEFARDDVLGEVALADEIGDDVDFRGIDHAEDLAHGGFFLPEGAVDF